MSEAVVERYRFDRLGNVVLDRRRFAPTANTDAYRTGDRIFMPRRSSPARERFHAQRTEKWLAKRAS